MPRHLIVAYQTAGGRALREEVERLARLDSRREFVLLVPATHIQHLFTWTDGESKAVARVRAEEAARLLRAAGIRLTDVRVGDADPYVAVAQELVARPGYDGIVVSTFPAGISRWLGVDLPRRLEKQFGLPVTHVVVEPETSP